MPIIEEKKAIRRSGEGIHTIILENRGKLSVTGVSDMDSFDENSVVLYTSQGLLSIRGSDLHINKLNIENGEVAVDGEIWSLDYSDGDMKKGGGFLSKLFR